MRVREKFRLNRWLFAPLCVCCLVRAGAAGTVLFVDDDAERGGDGTSWDSALTDLQAALAIAAEPGSDVDEIRVAGGIYKPDGSFGKVPGSGDPTVSFDLVDGLTIMGGYAGVLAPDPDERDIDLYPTSLEGLLVHGTSDCCRTNSDPGCETTECVDVVCLLQPSCCEDDWDDFCVELANIFCDLDCPEDFIEDLHSFHVVTSFGVSAVLDGLSITNGRARSPAPPEDRFGGGVFLTDGQLTAIDCTFDSNTTQISGGSLYAINSDVTLVGCDFLHAESIEDGGGAYLLDCNTLIDSCTFIDHLADDFGGAVRIIGGDALITNCHFQDNLAEFGGAIYTNLSHPEILDCTFHSNRAEQGGALYNIDGSPILTRCTFTDEHTNEDDLTAFGSGGAIRNLSGNPEITECVFDGLWAGSGGAVSNTSDGEPTFTDCIFTNNRAISESSSPGPRGGAVLATGNPEFVRCVFEANEAVGSSAAAGGAIFAFAHSLLVDCRFIENASRAGGAVYTTGEWRLVRCDFVGNEAEFGSAIFKEANACMASDCTFDSNTSLHFGAIFLFHVPTESVIQNSLFINNSGSHGGGLVAFDSPASVANTLFLGNSATDAGGAIASVAEGHVDLTNSTLAGNTAPLAAGLFSGEPPFWDVTTGTASVSNSILWNNIDDSGQTEQAQLFAETPSDLTIDYSCVQGLTGLYGGEGNIADDPMFVDGDGPDDQWGTFDDDVRLLAGSPCIDAADNTVVPADTLDLDGDGDTKEPLPIDFAGLARFVDDPDTIDTGVGDPPIIDMGAHEVQADMCLADLDGDEAVGPGDLAVVLGNWGPVPPSDPIADLDDDGVVGPADLAILLGNWGPCP